MVTDVTSSGVHAAPQRKALQSLSNQDLDEARTSTAGKRSARPSLSRRVAAAEVFVQERFQAGGLGLCVCKRVGAEFCIGVADVVKGSRADTAADASGRRVDADESMVDVNGSSLSGLEWEASLKLLQDARPPVSIKFSSGRLLSLEYLHLSLLIGRPEAAPANPTALAAARKASRLSQALTKKASTSAAAVTAAASAASAAAVSARRGLSVPPLPRMRVPVALRRQFERQLERQGSDAHTASHSAAASPAGSAAGPAAVPDASSAHPSRGRARGGVDEADCCVSDSRRALGRTGRAAEAARCGSGSGSGSGSRPARPPSAPAPPSPRHESLTREPPSPPRRALVTAAVGAGATESQSQSPTKAFFLELLQRGGWQGGELQGITAALGAAPRAAETTPRAQAAGGCTMTSPSQQAQPRSYCYHRRR